MSSRKRPSDGLHCSSLSKIGCVKSGNQQSSKSSESILTKNEMNLVEVMDTPDKSENDKKSYRVIQLANGLKALLVSDPTQKSDAAEEPDDNHNHDTETEQMATSDEDEETQSEGSDDETENPSHKEKRGKLAACSLCVDVGSFSDPRDVQGLAHFLGKINCHLKEKKMNLVQF